MPLVAPDTNFLEHRKATLGDRYAIQRELGRGGMTTVYLVNDLKHDREIALKVLHPQVTVTLGTYRFLLGGSSAVIATRWPVGAASATLSAHVHAFARGGAPLCRSPHDARLALRRDPATSHPFYWASHVPLH